MRRFIRFSLALVLANDLVFTTRSVFAANAAKLPLQSFIDHYKSIQPFSAPAMPHPMPFLSLAQQVIMANPIHPAENSDRSSERLQAAGSADAAQAAAQVFDGSTHGSPGSQIELYGPPLSAVSVPLRNASPFRGREAVVNYLERNKTNPLMIGRIGREVFDMLIYEGFSEEEAAAAFDRAKEVSARDLTVPQIRQEVRYQLVHQRLAALLPPDYERKRGGDILGKVGNAVGYAPLPSGNGTAYHLSLQLDFRPWLLQWGDWDMIRDGVLWTVDILPKFQEYFSLHRELLYHPDRLGGLIAKDQVFADLLAGNMTFQDSSNLLHYARGESFHMNSNLFDGKDVVFSPSDILIAHRTMWRNNPDWHVPYRWSPPRTGEIPIGAAVILEMARRLGQAPTQRERSRLIAAIRSHTNGPSELRARLVEELLAILDRQFPRLQNR